jgi:hypothetical protein
MSSFSVVVENIGLEISKDRKYNKLVKLCCKER